MPLESSRSKKHIPEGVWAKCEKCEQIIYNKELEENLKVCPKCGGHFRLNSRERIAQLCDAKSFKEIADEIQPVDPLGFVDGQAYDDRVAQAQKRAGLSDACV